MPRTADYTIQGFLYQFNKTALEILNAQDEDTITIEGIAEDIEIASTASLTAIQCKYHEASTSFTPRKIYEPLLQMLKHFSENSTANIHYILFAHFPSVSTSPTVDKTTLQAALESKNTGLEKYITAIPTEIHLDDFITHFTMEFGPSYDEIAIQVGKALEANGFSAEDVETLAYPNTIHQIATLSVQHAPSNRKITKIQFVSNLKAIRTTTISRWTLALKTREKLLQARRKQLKVHLDKNVRLRYFIIHRNSLEDYEKEIILFISDYINKYHFKPAHTNTPILCISADRDHLLSIQGRLFAKQIIAETGYIGGEFKESRFFREPMSMRKDGGKIQKEFAIRLLNWDEHGEVLNNKKCDDLFIIGDPTNSDLLDTTDINVEQLAGVTMKEIKYVIGVSNVYE